MWYEEPLSKKRGRQYYLDPPEAAEAGTLHPQPRPIDNKRVCAKFFSFAVGKSNNFLYQPSTPTKTMAMDLHTSIFRKSPKEDMVVGFMQELSQYYQLSPDKDFIFLPFPKRSHVYTVMTGEVDPSRICQESYFLRVWRHSGLCSHIKLRKQLRFALCDVCVEFRERQLTQLSIPERLQMKKAQVDHHQFVKMERQCYYLRQDRGIAPHIDAMSMIVDAADQSRYALPYCYISTHSSQKALRVPVHLMGVLVHGEAVHGFTYFESFKQGNNVTIEAIYEALATKLAKDGKLPSVLYLQLDNTSKQCKGRFMIGFLGYLILKGVFRRIMLSFLPVGHTHEDIDQFFSRLATYLSCHDAANIDELHDAIRRCYQTKAGVRAQTAHWDRCANFSEWIDPFLTKYKGISRFRQFRFYMKDSAVHVQARVNTTGNEEWAGITGNDDCTPVFKRSPPTRMTEVPPTQRRPYLDPALAAKQKESIAKMCRARHIEPARIADVLRGIESLADKTDLPFQWDLDRVFDWDPALFIAGSEGEEGGADPVEEQEPFDYEYQEGQVVLLKPGPKSSQSFWLGEVVALGTGSRRGEYEIWWMASKRTFGTYHREYNGQRPHADWVFVQACQCAITMVSKGKKISAGSTSAIKKFVARWKQAEESDCSADENEEVDSDYGEFFS